MHILRKTCGTYIPYGFTSQHDSPPPAQTHSLDFHRQVITYTGQTKKDCLFRGSRNIKIELNIMRLV